MSSEVLSFAEESCWSGEDFRSKRKSVTFRIFSIGRSLGEKFDRVFEADYGLWYDQEDEVLLYHLSELELDVPWADMVFHRRMDQSGIDIYDPESDNLVARIEVRRYDGRRTELTEGDLGPTVTRMSDWVARRAALAEREEGSDPSGEESGTSGEEREGDDVGRE